jgi:uncharacterized membrane protein
MVAWIIATPFTCSGVWYVDGGYASQQLPLNKADDWLNAANSFIPYDPQAVAQDIQHAWTEMNISERNVGIGNGSNCWFWATPSQTYGYYAIIFGEMLQSVNSYIAGGGLFHNTTFTTWTGISGAINIVTSTFSGATGMMGTGSDMCIGDPGNEQGFILFIGYLVVIALLIIMVPMSFVIRGRQYRREQERREAEHKRELEEREAKWKAEKEAQEKREAEKAHTDSERIINGDGSRV